ncbi:MAG TPA: hypothetical protein PKY56_07635 [Candidatus Kapabacteria bacterium]|nr:hypothetical protein [Candidatus Kapabacteria bacterium]
MNVEAKLALPVVTKLALATDKKFVAQNCKSESLEGKYDFSVIKHFIIMNLLKYKI